MADNKHKGSSFQSHMAETIEKYASEIESLKDRLEWTEFNLDGANAEVRKGREIIEFVQKTIDSINADEAVFNISKRLEEFYASYTD